MRLDSAREFRDKDFVFALFAEPIPELHERASAPPNGQQWCPVGPRESE